MKKIILILLVAFSEIITAQTGFSEIAGRPGAFSRMGFGARGKGMGNAMSAVIEGNLVSYYNPAVSVFQEGNSVQTAYSFLSLDRSLNFLNFTRKFVLGAKKNSDGSDFQSALGVSLGVINSGVDGWSERNNDGIPVGDLSTSENQFFLGLSNKFSEKFSAGVAFKLYYYKLYEGISATGLGLDIGLLYRLNENITIAAVVTDLNSKYEWDTSDLYGQQGNNTTNKFPITKKIGLSYKFDNPDLLAAIEFENSNAGTNFIRIGAEYNIFEGLYLRSGLDNFNLSNTDFPVRPAFGFSYFYFLDNWFVGIDYAFAIEPYSSHDQHIVGVNINL